VSPTGKSILLVDDDQDIRELLQTYSAAPACRCGPWPMVPGFARPFARAVRTW